MNAPRNQFAPGRFASDSLFRTALESSPDCVQILDLEGQVQFVNRNGAILLGSYDASDLLGRDWLHLWGDAEQPAAAAALRRAALGETQRILRPAAAIKGPIRYFDNVIVPMSDDDGVAVALLVTSRDVTELEAARRTAEERERRTEMQAAVLRTAGELAKLGGWESNIRTQRLHRSEQAVHTLGGGPRDLSWEEARLIYDEADRVRIAELLRHAHSTGERIIFEAPITRYDGARAWIRLLGEPRYEGGEFIGLRGAYMDITDEKAAEETIRRAEQRLILALKMAGMCVYELDFDQRQLTHHRSEASVIDHTPTFDDLWPDLETIVAPADRERVTAEWEAAKAAATTFQTEFRVNRADGQEVWAYAVAETIRDEAGVPRRLIGALKDVTERKRDDLRVQATMSRMREHEARQKLLLDELNHRVKNTLAAVQSVAVQTLRDEGDLKGARDLFIERLLALSSTHNLLVRRAWDSACLHELAETTLRPYGRPYALSGPDLRLDPNFAVSLGMALHELATNALKHGAWRGAGRVDIEVVEREGGDISLTWRESGGAAVVQPTRRGFGSRLLQRGIARELNGEVSMDFADTGLVCAIHVPASDRLMVLHEQP